MKTTFIKRHLLILVAALSWHMVYAQNNIDTTTRGLYIKTPTGVTDFRGIQTNVPIGAGYQFFASGNAPSVFAGRTYIGDTMTSNSFFIVSSARSSAGQVSIGKKSGAGAISFINADGNTFGTVGYRTGTVSGDFIVSSAGGGGSLAFATGGTDKMMITTSGNIGVGVANPQEKLHVNGNILTTSKLYVGSLYRTIGDVMQSDSLSHVMSFRNSTGVGNPKGGFDFGDVGGVSWMRIVGGKVGIGTTQPQSELAVNGIITAQRVRVTSQGWADFVFDPSYQLTPLLQVEKYIQQNRHLPDVPSESEVTQQGVDIGQNQATLLRKLEELTLYAIEQNKRLEAQKREIEIQKERNDKLMVRLEEVEKQLKNQRFK